MRCSLVLPIAVTRPEQAVPFANLVRWTKAHRFWQGQSPIIDSHQLLSWLAGLGIRVPAGFGVSLTPLRAPYQAAMEARTVSLTTGHEVLAAFGPGAPNYQAAVLGRPYAKPLTLMHEYLSAVKGLVAGELVAAEGEYVSMEAQLVPLRAAKVRVGAGVLRPRMAEVAGRIADDAVTWLCGPEHIQDTLIPRIRAGEEKAGRTTRVGVTAFVPVAVAREGRDMVDTAYGTFGMHLQADHYQDTLRHAGLDVTGEREDAKKLIDAGLFLYGTPADIRDGLERYRRAGVDEVVLNTVGVAALYGAREAAKDLEDILET
ncbi:MULTISPECIES: LLM class flavin-dependent oxidoreductase [unclassified Streptomyces]|uniref:LLM class flavin-dependent oxidoreductase n=1 Tax=unclassified Streptomyces TaxID=2593676 RepID=UPI003651AD7D